ncbi:MAG TPA: copper-binding protein [Ramlibacter sp.]|nr:copper-binding protein [Ramlibacter sp.]
MNKTLLALVLGLNLATGVSAAPAEWVEATVVAADAARGKLTLKHQPIRSIGMDAMTMPFKVQDKALAAGLKPGDKIRFQVRNDGGELLITGIRSAAR